MCLCRGFNRPKCLITERLSLCVSVLAGRLWVPFLARDAGVGGPLAKISFNLYPPYELKIESLTHISPATKLASRRLLNAHLTHYLVAISRPLPSVLSTTGTDTQMGG